MALLAVIVMVAAGCDWVEWGGGPGHGGATSDTDVTAPNLPAFVAKTAFSTAPTGQVAVADGLAFVVRDGSLTALDERTDEPAWLGTLPTGSTYGTAPAIDPDSRTVFVVVGGSAPALVGFDVAGVRNCNLVQYRCAPTFFATLGTATVATPPVVSQGIVLAAGPGNLEAFDAAGHTSCAVAATGSLCSPLWKVATGATALGVGPAAGADSVFVAAQTNGVGQVRALRLHDGTALWSAVIGAPFATATPALVDGTVVVPADSALRAFAAGGCGAPSCTPSQSFAGPTGSTASFLATPTIDGGQLFATSSDNRVDRWSLSGCGNATCVPNGSLVVAASVSGQALRQSVVAVNGVLVLGATRIVGGADHAMAVALDEGDLHELTHWDLGAGAMGARLATASVAAGTVYVPTDHSLVALRLPAPRPLSSLTVSPLTLSPAFSPTTTDYVVLCAAGTNTLAVTATAAPGGTVALTAPTTTTAGPSLSTSVTVNEGDPIVFAATDATGRSSEYWVRCLPHDFPMVTVRHPHPGGPTPGWYLAGTNYNLNGPQSFAMILDTNGTPVWYKRADPGHATDVTPLGPDKLAAWGMAAHWYYDVFDLASGQNSTIGMVGQVTDPHELLQEPNGNHMMISYDPTYDVDLSGMSAIAPAPAPTAKSPIQDCRIQELDPNGNVVWSWEASDHIDPKTETTYVPLPTTLINGTYFYDVFHCNSIDVNPVNGNVLVSFRHLNAVMEIRKSDGKVLWKLGGTATNKDGARHITVQNDPYGSFVQQHDARYWPTGSGITLFDNQTPTNGHAARAVDYAIDFTAGTAHPVFSFANTDGVGACCLGDNRPQLDGHRMIGWGALSPSTGLFATELDAAGNDVLDLLFPVDVASYRVVKTPPSMFDLDVLRHTSGP
jgi:hypothetical protein